MAITGRIIILIAAAWVIMAATEPKPSPPQPHPLETVAKPMSDIATTPRAQAQRFDPSKPCPVGRDDRASDLCAQWKAADAAAVSAKWTFWSAMMAFVSAVGIVGTLGLSTHSNVLARKSLELASSNAQRELRAYVYQHGVELSRHWDDIAEYAWWRIALTWRNVGNTPTRTLALQVWPYLEPVDLPEDYPFDLYEEPTPTHLHPGGERSGSYITITADEAARVRNGELHFYVWGWARYHDVFEGTPEHQTRFCYRVTFFGNPAEPLSDHNIVQISTSFHTGHNDAT